MGRNASRPRTWTAAVAVGCLCLVSALSVRPAAAAGDPAFPARWSLRLVGGTKPSEGRVEIFNGQDWGTVCDDGFGVEEATVACRELGYTGGVTVSAWGGGRGGIFMDDVVCYPDQHQRLHECLRAADSTCFHLEDVGVRCYEHPSPSPAPPPSLPPPPPPPPSPTSVLLEEVVEVAAVTQDDTSRTVKPDPSTITNILEAPSKNEVLEQAPGGDSNGRGLPQAAVVGIVAALTGVVVLVLLTLAAVALVVMRRRQSGGQKAVDDSMSKTSDLAFKV